MAALRISRPGQPTILLDLGPATARRAIGRYSTMGGSIVEGRVTPRSMFPSTTPARRAQIAAYKARVKAGDVCGKRLPRIQELCARVAGHRDHCRSRGAMRAMALRVRSA